MLGNLCVCYPSVAEAETAANIIFDSSEIRPMLSKYRKYILFGIIF